MSDDFLVTISDLKKVGACHKGTREWAANVGLDWLKFVSKGILASELLATGDHFAERAVMLLRAQRGDRKDG